MIDDLELDRMVRDCNAAAPTDAELRQWHNELTAELNRMIAAMPPVDLGGGIAGPGGHRHDDASDKSPRRSSEN